MRQDEKSGHVFYVVRGGGDGKMIIEQGEIHSLTYDGKPIEALELGALPIRRAIVVPSASAKMPAASAKTPSLMAVLAALEMGGAQDPNAPGRPKIDIGEVFSER
jgi:hypothetical protein